MPAKVATIEYDPNRTCYIALLHYVDGAKAYVLAPQGVKVGDQIESGEGADIRPGNALPLRAIPTGTVVHNVELIPGQGGKLGRSAGSAIQVVAKEGDRWSRCACPPRRCAWCAPTAARRWAPSRTPSIRT